MADNSPQMSQNRLEALHGKLSPAFRRQHILLTVGHFAVMLLSLGLIVFISVDTFKDIPFLNNKVYMTFQFWVCIIFMLDFFLGLFLSSDRRGYFKRQWLFLLISIPYLNIISVFHIDFEATTLYYIRFIPLFRGAYALMIVVGYFSSNRALSLIAQYAVLLLSVIYFSSLIFYYVEKDINSDVNTYWDALYWAFMNMDTVGSYISAVSVIGKILSIILAVSGMMMLPLFTVYVTSRVKEYNDRREMQTQEFLASVRREEQALKDSDAPKPFDSTKK